MALLPSASWAADTPPPRQIAGIYPHLAFFNDENECGTGAVVPWADRLWVVTYSPHSPRGSSDKLYEITPDLRQIVRPESIGGTPANRMIHEESGQLFIGPYVIDRQRQVRVIPYSRMFGRPTGNARHLTRPADLVYCATMEEGLYEIDARTLEVTELWTDEQLPPRRPARLPGYHGKGLFSGQGRIVYANNGEHGPEAQRRPDVPSGVLAEWDGRADAWTVVRRAQFTEVTGPGGIHGGNRHPETDPLWSIGWDHRSLVLMVLHQGRWHAFRLPKSSHSYDGAHGWNTEWPRIRDIGERDLLMTMHGAFWRFPRDFRPGHTGGLRPRSNYLKVVGDFTRWQDRIVLGCDDTARAEFLNRRRAKGGVPAPQSQSNLWFVEPDTLDQLGPAIGHGGPWVHEDVDEGAVSDPFLVAGFDQRWLHLAHEGSGPATIAVEIDRQGAGQWTTDRTVDVPARAPVAFEISGRASWVRLRSRAPLTRATAWFHLSQRDRRHSSPERQFLGLAHAGSTRVSGGRVLARAGNRRTLALSAVTNGPSGPQSAGTYELDAELKLRRVANAAEPAFEDARNAMPSGVLGADAASIVFVDDGGRRWRLPRADADFEDIGPLGVYRVDREVATERDLFHAHGTFYELPAENAGGFARLRPITTHRRHIHDYCSWRGLLVLSGVDLDAAESGGRILRSDDGRVALWAGALDELWRMGKPRGMGGPWSDTPVSAGVPSDPYLMNGYDRKRVTLRHDAKDTVVIALELEIAADGRWHPYRSFEVPPGRTVEHTFPPGYGAYWVRAVASRDGTATVQFNYD